MGTAAVVVGVLALLLSVFFPVGLPLAVIGLVLGILGRRRVRRGEATNGGAALVGVALSVVALLVAVAAGLLFGFVFSQVQDCADPDLSRAEQEACIQDRLDS
jgi:TctA family transporter